LSALGDPLVVNFNLPVFDFTNGETVLADVTTGGNPDLVAETQRDWKFAANWELPFWERARFQIEYIRNRSDDVVSNFPQITSEIENAFPDRITRDASGTLIALDRRQVTFAETRADRLNVSLNLRGSIGGSRSGGPSGIGRGRRPGGAQSGRPSGATGGPRTGVAGRPPSNLTPSDGPPSPERRAAFAQFREQICGEDGLDVLTRLAAAVANGDDISAIIPGGLTTERLKRLVERATGDNGIIDPERVAAFRTRICSRGAGAARGGEQQSGAQQSGRPTDGGVNPLARRNFSGFRYFVSLNHTIELDNEILIASGLAPLDQLGGQSTNAFGLPRHTSRLEVGLFGQGVGMRLSGRYTGSTRLDGSSLSGSTAIFFNDLATFDLRLFANIDELTGSESPILENVRVSLRADNVFDGQLRVVDESGDTPINFQPFLIDPVGRFIGIDVRKLF